MTKVIKIYDSEPNERHLRQVCDTLRGGGVVILPTDSFYGYGCAISSIKAINRIKNIKKKGDDNLSLICSSISMAAEYSRIDNYCHRILKDNTPGAFTFIMQPASKVPAKFFESKKSVGIRIPTSPVALAIVEALGEPIVTSSITMEQYDMEDRGTAELVFEEYGEGVDLIVDGGDLSAIATTVVDISSGEITTIRESQAELKI